MTVHQRDPLRHYKTQRGAASSGCSRSPILFLSDPFTRHLATADTQTNLASFFILLSTLCYVVGASPTSWCSESFKLIDCRYDIYVQMTSDHNDRGQAGEEALPCVEISLEEHPAGTSHHGMPPVLAGRVTVLQRASTVSPLNPVIVLPRWHWNATVACTVRDLPPLQQSRSRPGSEHRP